MIPPRVPSVELRPIPGFIGYAAGSDGNIYSFKRKGRTSNPAMKYQTTPRALTPTPGNRYGHLYVSISTKYKRCYVAVHRLICESFHGPCPKGMECSHINGDKLDNRPENLRWETRAQNNARRKDHGTEWTGSRHGNSKLNEWMVRVARRAYPEGVEATWMAGVFGVDVSSLCKAIRGATWTRVPTPTAPTAVRLPSGRWGAA